MTQQDYLKLRNGSDVRGVACEGVPGESVTLTTEAAECIAKAFCVWLLSHTGQTRLTIAVGYDSRITSPALCEAVVNGILSTGHNAVVTGLSTTPSMFALLKDDRKMKERYCNGAIMITASHLPFNRNGLKFFWHNGGLDGSQVKEFLSLCTNYRFAEPNVFGERVESPYLDDYAATLVEKVRQATGEEKPLAGKRILVDAGNGAGGFYASKVLAPLGADTTGSQFLDPDGTFPNHIPNPENVEAMQSVRDAVLKAKADLGIIFDTDADRVGAVNKDGAEINRNAMIALISAILLKERTGTIVTDSITSDGLTKFIHGLGGKHFRFKRGYKNVIDRAILLNESGEYTPLAIETSGHAALLENYFLDDGAYLITRILIAMATLAKEGKELTDLIAHLETPAEEKEIRLQFIGDGDFRVNGKKLLADVEKYAENHPYAYPAPNSYEGVRLCYDEHHGNGWALVRMSLHDPILPINVESNVKDGVVKIMKDLYYFLRDYDFLDVTALQKAIESWRTNKINELNEKFVASGKIAPKKE